MPVFPRLRVYLPDTLPPQITTELGVRGLVSIVTPAVIGSLLTAAQAPECRAILVHLQRPTQPPAAVLMADVLNQLAGPALDNGVLVVLVVDGDPDDRAAVIAAVDAAVKGLGGKINTYRYRPNIVVWSPDGASKLAQTCADHVPGLPWRDVPTEVSPSDLQVSAPDRHLLQRAFSDCDEIGIRLLQRRTARYGQVCVYRIQPRRTGLQDPIPFIVKIGHPEVIDGEEGATVVACGDHTPYPYFPPLAPERFVSGQDRRALVSHFIDRAILFERYIQSHSPAMAVASLFDGPLRCWRSHGRTETVEVGRYALKNGLVRFQSYWYRNAHRAARRRVVNVRAPRQLIIDLRGQPAMQVYVCGSHGDLHLKNLFVRENSVDIVLIDFNRAGDAPASRDPAELEVSLAFSPPEEGTDPLDRAVLEALYTRPLLGRRDLPRQSHPRVLAIEQVRRQAAGSVTEDEYRVMVAAHCLYYARKGNADAYLAADRLI